MFGLVMSLLCLSIKHIISMATRQTLPKVSTLNIHFKYSAIAHNFCGLIVKIATLSEKRTLFLKTNASNV